MSRQRDRGFGAVEVLAVLLVLALTGVGGWYVYHKAHKPKALPVTTTTTVPTAPKRNTAPSAPIDPTLDWTPFSSTKGQYSFRYPKTWSLAEHLDMCADGLTLLAPSEQSVGVCASENSGEVSVYGLAGDLRGNYKLGLDYKDLQTADITVDGVAGTRTTGTVANTDPAAGIGILPDNTKTVRYVFYTNGRTYVLDYNQTPVYPDALNQFELLVTRTFKFSA